MEFYGMNQVDTQNGKVFPVPVFQKQVVTIFKIPTSISCNYNCIDKFNERYITLQIYNLPPWPHMAKLETMPHVLHIYLKGFSAVGGNLTHPLQQRRETLRK